MSLLFNQIKHDLSRLRLLMLAFVAVVLLKFALLASYTLSPEKTAPFEWYKINDQFEFLTFIQYLVGSLVAATFVHQDSLCDREAFWLSRPISSFTMLLSKVVGIILVCVAIPVLSDAALILLQGFESGALIGIIPTIELSLLVYVPIVFIASITKSLSRLIAIVAFLLIASTSTLFIFDSVLHLNIDLSPKGLWKPILIFASLIGLLSATANQYLRRHLPSSITTGTLSVLIPIILASINLPEIPSRPTTKPSPIDPEQVSIDRGQIYKRAKDLYDSQDFEDTRKIAIHGIPQDRIWVLQNGDDMDVLSDSSIFGFVASQEAKRMFKHLAEINTRTPNIAEKDSFFIPVNDNSNSKVELSFKEYSLEYRGNLANAEGHTLQEKEIVSILCNTEKYEPKPKDEKPTPSVHTNILEVTPYSPTETMTGIPLQLHKKPATRIYLPKNDLKANAPENHQAIAIEENSFNPTYPIALKNRHEYIETEPDNSNVQEFGVFDVTLHQTYTLILDNL
ncbi:ABC transporter permease [Puniceicoccaceae bacterium K14]|nr:ABC transporter permease [Puniceicoccaceae bacterium K14]